MFLIVSACDSESRQVIFGNKCGFRCSQLTSAQKAAIFGDVFFAALITIGIVLFIISSQGASLNGSLGTVGGGFQ